MTEYALYPITAFYQLSRLPKPLCNLSSGETQNLLLHLIAPSNDLSFLLSSHYTFVRHITTPIMDIIFWKYLLFSSSRHPSLCCMRLTSLLLPFIAGLTTLCLSLSHLVVMCFNSSQYIFCYLYFFIDIEVPLFFPPTAKGVKHILGCQGAAAGVPISLPAPCPIKVLSL